MKTLATVTFALGALAALPAQAQDFVCMESNVGDFCLHLFRDTAPQTVDNFLRYVNDGDYDNSLIHRSAWGIDGSKFVIQGGGYMLTDENLVATIAQDAPVINEFSRSNLRGTVAMAKLGSDPNSATNQWFVNLGNNAANLDNQNGGFTVFAEVVSGMEVVDAISNLRRVNFADSLGQAFTEVPVTTPANVDSVQPSELIQIEHAYALDQLPSPYFCRLDSPQDAVAEFCGGTVTLPVRIGGIAYSATLTLVATSPTLELTVDKTSLKVLDEAPPTIASFDAASSTLRIPTLRNGNKVFRDIVLNLVDKPSLRFSLASFVKP